MVRDVRRPRPAGDLLPSLPAPAACPSLAAPPDMFQQVLAPLFSLSPLRLPSALLSPPPTHFLLISAFREAGGWEKSPRFRPRKVKFRGDKTCPRPQSWWLSLSPARGSHHCHSCTAGPARRPCKVSPPHTPGSHRCTHTPLYPTPRRSAAPLSLPGRPLPPPDLREQVACWPAEHKLSWDLPCSSWAT